MQGPQKLLLTLALPPLVALVGCKSPCQSLCDEMATYADECGFSYSEADLDTCYEDNARRVTSAESQDTCREYTDDLRVEWTCDDLSVYFNSGGGDAAATQGGGTTEGR